MMSLVLFLTLNPLQLQGTPILSSLFLQPSGYLICVCSSRARHCVTQFGNASASVSQSAGTTKGSSGLLFFSTSLCFLCSIFIFPLLFKKKKILVGRR